MTRVTEKTVCSWLSLIPIGIVWFGVIYFLAPHLVPLVEHYPQASQVFLKRSLIDCRPEPLEHLRYILTILLIPLLFVIFMTVYPHMKRLGNFGVNLVLLLQSLLLGFAVFLGIYQNRYVHAYFSGFYYINTAFCLGLFFLLRWGMRKGKLDFRRHFAASSFKSIVPIFILIYTAIRLLPSLFTDGNFSEAYGTVSYHLPFTMNEFAAVLNGRTPDVDFFPQYQTLTPYLLMPFFKVLGISITSYTAAMAFLSLFGFFLLFLVFKKLTQSAWIGALLYLPFCAISFFPTVNIGNEHQLNAFNYFAVGPLRYFGPWLVMYLCAGYFLKPSRARLFSVFFTAALAAINNPDFGVSALGAAFFSVSLLNLKAESKFFYAQSRTVLIFTAAIFTGMLCFFLISFIHSGHFPDYSRLLFFQKIFALYGYCMLPMPVFGMHWIFLFTFLGSILLAIFKASFRIPSERVSHKDLSKKNLELGLLAFSGVFGLGVLFYYVGRSHWEVLIAVFSAWGLSLMLLVWGVYQEMQMLFWIDKKVRVLPYLFLSYCYLMCAFLVWDFSPLKYQFQRLELDTGLFLGRESEILKVMRNYATMGEKVGIIYPLGHLLAIEARVVNVFPFSQNESIAIKSQVQTTLESFRLNHVSIIFGKVPSEMESDLIERGYTKYPGYGDFDVWKIHLS